jgi:hypothetical protein
MRPQLLHVAAYVAQEAPLLLLSASTRLRAICLSFVAANKPHPRQQA